jgi:hypothetical protein
LSGCAQAGARPQGRVGRAHAEVAVAVDPRRRDECSEAIDADGSIDLSVQNESPGKDKESNWLPAPKDEFALMMRLYWPKENPPSILDGTWKPPEVKEAS